MSRKNVDGPFSSRSHPTHTSLIPREALLYAMEDNDDIDWPENSFDCPHKAEPESQDELLVMIQFEGTPALQQALRALFRELIDILSTAVRPLPAKVMCLAICSHSATIPLKSSRCNKNPSQERLIGARSTL